MKAITRHSYARWDVLAIAPLLASTAMLCGTQTDHSPAPIKWNFARLSSATIS